MKNYQGPVFNKKHKKQSHQKIREPRFARMDQSMSFIMDNQSVNDNKERSPLLRDRLEFEQPSYSKVGDVEESTRKTEYQVPFKNHSLDSRKWVLSPDEELPQRLIKDRSLKSYKPALEKRDTLKQTNKKTSKIENNSDSDDNSPEEKVDKNLREIAKRMTKSQDSYLLFN